MSTGSQGLIRDWMAALCNVRTLTAVAIRKGDSTDDIPHKVGKWFLFDANDGDGWADQRVRWPKVHYEAQARKIVALYATGELTYADIGRMFGITEEGAQQAAQPYRERHPERDT